ncbi:MAG: ABC transporter permease [Dehalococcoidia bacterium]|nr:ABC transporter permease [Dehalococcoidia bacterium]
MIRFRSLPLLAVRRMRRNWRLLSSVATGTLVAAAVLSATSIYSDAIRDLGLQHALEHQDVRTLDVRVQQSNIPVTVETYQSGRQRQDATVSGLTQGAVQGVVRQAQSATFYPTAPGAAVAASDPTRPRGNVLFRSDFEQHVQLLEGALPAAMPDHTGAPMEVVVGPGTVEATGLGVGDEVDLHPYWMATTGPVRARIVGVVTETDPEERYWGTAEERVDARPRSWVTLRLWTNETTFFGALREAMPTMAADYFNIYPVHLDALNARNAVSIADGLARLPVALQATEERPLVTSGLPQVLRTFDEKLFFTRIPLLVLLLQIGAIVAYYLIMVSTMLVERQGAEIATMRSRGATTAQLLGIYGVEGTLLAALAALAGPPLAAAVISLLGPTPAFSALSDGGALSVHVGGTAYLLAGIGALIAFLSLMVPAWRVTRDSVVEFKRGAARPHGTPLFLRYYLDVVIVLVVAALFWRLSQQEELFTEGLFGETTVDPVLLATPAVFMVTVGVVFLRLFPVALRGVAWAVGWTRSVAILVGMRSLVRQPAHYTRLILLLMFATGVGMFGATFSATLGRSYEDRAGYESGADVRGLMTAATFPGGEAALYDAASRVPADGASVATRISGSILVDPRRGDSVTVLGVDPTTFGEVAYIRDDFASQSVDEIMATLAASSVQVAPGPLLPEGTQQLGMWVRFMDIRGRVSVGISLRDATGRISNRVVASAAPVDEAAGEWQFFTVDLNRALSRTGARSNEPPLQGPVEVLGAFIGPSGRIAQQRGVVLIGPLHASAEAVAEGGPIGEVRASAWPGSTPLVSFTEPRFQVVQGLVPTAPGDVARPSADDAPAGESGVLRYEWFDTQFSPNVRGVSLAPPSEVFPVYLDRGTMQLLSLSVGDTFSLVTVGRYLPARIAGALEYFPTYAPQSRGGLLVMDASRLLASLNTAIPDRATLPNELWFDTDDPEATIDALAALGITSVVDRAALQLEQQEDPLIAAGWSGILAISFGAVLLLSAIGFIVYSYLTAQERGLEFAILRTLGFSKPQILSVVLFEHLFVIATGMGLGTLVGLRVGSIMMGFLATDETGAAVAPPFILGVSWPQVFAVWAILGTVFVVTIGAVVALYFRLAVHRVLRIGDA